MYYFRVKIKLFLYLKIIFKTIVLDQRKKFNSVLVIRDNRIKQAKLLKIKKQAKMSQANLIKKKT